MSSNESVNELLAMRPEMLNENEVEKRFEKMLVSPKRGECCYLIWIDFFYAKKKKGRITLYLDLDIIMMMIILTISIYICI